jgi:adenylyltransferase/sulfurtransferase
VLGVLPGIIATIQATEVVKLLAGVGEPLVGRLLLYDALELTFREFKVGKDPECPACGENPTITELIDYDGFCGLTPEQPVAQLSASALADRLRGGEDVVLLDVREFDERAKACIDGSRWIPLNELGERLGELEDRLKRPIVVHCHRGGRSETAVRQLRERGFQKVENLDGGIEAWSLTVDPSVVRY